MKNYKEITIDIKGEIRTIVRVFKKDDFKGDAVIQIQVYEGVRYVNTTEENLKEAIEMFAS